MIWFHREYTRLSARVHTHEPPTQQDCAITVRHPLCDDTTCNIGRLCSVKVSMGLLVQCFFAHRVWNMSGKKIAIPIAIVTLSTTQFCLGIYYTTTIQKSGFIETLSGVSWAATIGIAIAMTADFLITSSLCYHLRKIRSGMQKSDRLVNLLVLYTVNTGLLTSMNAIASIVMTTVFNESFWLSVPFCLVSKCYVNSVLAT
ncbi:hypothetical protein OBBRIDRAFT_57434 [Obba rivulosa]|uniref:DUF6534 domain-containing protein n=1 Tax=Obba rivulosa TaxID=1052685 RepID=A0A8E2AYE7_9APHY|nr:hypothetical protein OBBRIDRAFT_57434 [Obba rivulosa]